MSIGVRASKNETEIYFAREGKTLEHFKNQDMNQLKAMVVKWIYMLGLTGKVSEQDINANTQIIADLFPRLTLKQIELAIKLSMQGELGVDVETYGAFSPLYISKIIKAYLVFSSSKIKELNWRKESIQKMNEKQLQEPYESRLVSRKKLILNYIENVTSHNKYYGDYNNVMWELVKGMNALNPQVAKWIEEATEWSNTKAILESQSVQAKRFSTMGNEQKEKELELLRKLYGRYYVIRAFLLSLENPIEWATQLEDKTILEK